MSIIAWVDGVIVITHGRYPKTIAEGIKDGFMKAFNSPASDHPEVQQGSKYIGGFPTGVNNDGTSIDIVGLLVTAQGSSGYRSSGPMIDEHLGNLR